MFKKLIAIRGATCVDADTPEAIQKAVKNLFDALYERNCIKDSSTVSIQFTMTEDLTTLNAAAALRRAGYGSSVPLFCSQEPTIQGMLPKVVRVLITCYSRKPAEHVYMNGAEKLRPDLSK